MSAMPRMSVEGPPLWDALQRDTLAAMGLPVYRMLGAAVPGTGPAASPAASLPESAWPDDPLIAALLRAAGRSRDAHDAAQLVRGWPAPQTLRRDPQAKRALWPALRALRRSPA